jgi:hypothetical protein
LLVVGCWFAGLLTIRNAFFSNKDFQGGEGVNFTFSFKKMSTSTLFQTNKCKFAQ